MGLIDQNHFCSQEQDLQNLATEFSKILKAGDVCLLHGEVGAGKTFFTTHVYEAMGGIRGITGSPSFTIVNHYPLGALDFFHIDLYRLDDVVEEDSIDQENWMNPNGYSFIEWAERFQNWQPDRGYELYFKYYGTGREVLIKKVK